MKLAAPHLNSPIDHYFSSINMPLHRPIFEWPIVMQLRHIDDDFAAITLLVYPQGALLER